MSVVVSSLRSFEAWDLFYSRSHLLLFFIYHLVKCRFPLLCHSLKLFETRTFRENLKKLEPICLSKLDNTTVSVLNFITLQKLRHIRIGLKMKRKQQYSRFIQLIISKTNSQKSCLSEKNDKH